MGRRGSHPGSRKPLAAAVGALLLCAAAFARPAAAATITVNTTSDSTGVCSLRDAISAIDAQANGGGCTNTSGNGYGTRDRINVNATGTITLTSALPNVSKSVTIQGPGASALTVDGASTYLPFYVNPGPLVPVTISGLTVANGHGSNIASGIYNAGKTLLSGVVVTGGNSTGDIAYGAVENDGGTLTVFNTTVSGNHSTSTLVGNFTSASGGIWTNSALIVTGSTISGNTATASASGSGNGASATGGAIYGAGSVAVSLSTISGNSVSATGTAGATSSATGGGIQMAGNYSFAVHDSTITGNSASHGANLDDFSATSTRRVGDTIISNPLGGGANCTAVPITNDGYNLEDDAGASCGFGAVTHDLVGVNPMLGPLANYGGSTPTHALLAGSPAIDQGKVQAPEADQRGFQRPIDFSGIANAPGGDGSDIGAFEVQPACAAQTTPSDPCTTATSPLPSNAFSVGGVKGKTLLLDVSSPGTASVSDAASPLSAESAKSKLLLDHSSASGGRPTISVPLILSKLGKRRLRQKGKVSVDAKITFTPTGGTARTQTATLKIKRKK